MYIINHLIYIAFGSQGEIGGVAKEMDFGEDIFLKFTCLNAREGGR